jgi:hypothetical protein
MSSCNNMKRQDLSGMVLEGSTHIVCRLGVDLQLPCLYEDVR